MTNEMCRDGKCDFERSESDIGGSDINSSNDVIMAGIFIVGLVLAAAIANNL